MTTAYIGIGSNMGDRTANCKAAVGEIGRIPGCRVVDRSDWFFTEPVGVHGQEWYLNGVAAADVEIPARELLDHLLAIEKKMGRVRKDRWEPRILDLDLLLFGGGTIHEDGLAVPHPLMHQRRFVLVPLSQMAPDLNHPVLQKTMAELLDALPEDGQAVTSWKGE
jgi:2-amino-4-hydroxy-6-hydroxymethyldihydropteridine diphosphokinase